MMEDVIGALRSVRALDVVAVVTEDPAVARLAHALGARAMLRNVAGLNPSLEGAAAELAADGAHALLVVLGDVAGALPEDIQALLDALAALGGRGVVLSPSRDGGTSALLRAPHDAIASAFGPDSAARHRALARAADLPWRELERPSLALDLDSAEDLEAFQRGAKGGERTRAVLRELGWSDPS
jgi:2-phospho-L-lactate guanylyltransferase